MKTADTIPSTRGNRALAAVTLSHFLNHLNSTGMSFIISVFVATGLGLSAAAVGLVVSVGSFSAGLFQLAFSFLIRKYSGRVLLAVGNTLMAISGTYFGLSSVLSNFVGARILWGLGSAPQHPVGTSVISDNFVASKRGGVLGLSNGLTFLGNVLGPLTSLELVLLFGWRISSFVLGGIMVIATIGTLLLIESRVLESTVRKVSGSFKSFLTALKDRDVLLVTLSSATIGTGGLGVLTTFLPLYFVRSLGFSTQLTAILTTAYLMGGPLGSNFLGRLSDRWSRKNASMTAIIMTGILVVLLTFTGRNIFSLAAVLFVLGVFSLSIGTVQQSYLSGISNAPIRDMAYGIYFTLNFGVGAVWTSIAGVIISIISYDNAFRILAATTVPSAILLFLSREFKK